MELKITAVQPPYFAGGEPDETIAQFLISALEDIDKGSLILLPEYSNAGGISDIEKCREPLYTTDESGERGGMGFAIMESFTDKMTVTSKLGSGTTVTLYKKLS